MSATFLKDFNTITDPLIERCKKYELIDILLLAISTVLSGAEGWEDIEDFGHLKLDWLKKYGAFEAGIPKHDTIARVICRLKADEIERAFQSWISSLIETTGADIIAIDGKAARRSFTTKDRKSALHTVSAWSCQHQLVLGQTAVDSKTNEITAIPELLTMLDIENSIITLDAMGCQEEIAKQIIKQKADYILALKGNHSGMQSELEAWWHKGQGNCIKNRLTQIPLFDLLLRFKRRKMNKKKLTLIEHFKDIADPRLQRKQLHKLDDIFFITLCAVICGCDGWVAIEKFANMKRSWFEQYLSLEHGIPSHDTFGRVFSLIDPEQFQVCFSNWIKSIVKTVTGDVIAVDGKCLRRSHDKLSNKSAIYMVSAWSHDNQLTLGQVKVDEKSNEITALPALLENLDITGAIITTDALNTQKNSAKIIVEKGGDYLSALKGNQSTLHDDVTLFFENTPKSYIERLTSHKTIEKGHGRIEEREVTSCNNIDWLTKEHEHPHLASIVSVKSRRFHNNEWSQETRYFISSVKHNDAEKFAHYVRAHWGVENNLHWTLDIAFDEDSCRIRKGFADQNMAILRHISLNLLKSETEHKVGIKIKRQMAGWDNDYLLKVLQIF